MFTSFTSPIGLLLRLARILSFVLFFFSLCMLVLPLHQGGDLDAAVGHFRRAAHARSAQSQRNPGDFDCAATSQYFSVIDRCCFASSRTTGAAISISGQRWRWWWWCDFSTATTEATAAATAATGAGAGASITSFVLFL